MCDVKVTIGIRRIFARLSASLYGRHYLNEGQKLDNFPYILNGEGSLVPRLHSPAFLALCTKTGSKPGPFHHVLHEVECVVWCVVLLIELRVTFFVVRPM